MSKFLNFMLVSCEKMRSTRYANLLSKKLFTILDKVTFLWYIVTMTARTTFEPCSQKKVQENDFQGLTNLKCVLYL